jgi:hypothetical protein
MHPRHLTHVVVDLVLARRLRQVFGRLLAVTFQIVIDAQVQVRVEQAWLALVVGQLPLVSTALSVEHGTTFSDAFTVIEFAAGLFEEPVTDVAMDLG